MDNQLIAMGKLKKEILALQARMKRLRNAYIKGEYEGREDEYDNLFDTVKQEYNEKTVALENLEARSSSDSSNVDDDEDEKFCEIITSFLDEIETNIKRKSIATSAAALSWLVDENRQIHKNNVRELLVHAAKILTRPDASQFRDWLVNRFLYPPLPRCLKNTITGPARTAAEQIDLDEVWYDAILARAGQPGVQQLNVRNISDVLAQLSGAISDTEYNEFQEWIAKRVPRLGAVITIINAQFSDYGVIHRCPICGQDAVSQKYQIVFHSSPERECRCPDGHTWQVTWQV